MFHSDISLGVYDQIYFKKCKLDQLYMKKRKDDITERQMNGDWTALKVDWLLTEWWLNDTFSFHCASFHWMLAFRLVSIDKRLQVSSSEVSYVYLPRMNCLSYETRLFFNTQFNIIAYWPGNVKSIFFILRLWYLRRKYLRSPSLDTNSSYNW